MNDRRRTVDRGGRSFSLGKPFRWIILAAGLIFMCVGGGLLFSSYSFQQTAISTTATVLSVETKRTRKRASDGDWKVSVTHLPTLRYTDAIGVDRDVTPTFKSSTYDFAIGSTVDIFVDPDAPDTVRINDFMTNWGFGGIFFTFGLVLSTLGYFMTRRNGQ